MFFITHRTKLGGVVAALFVATLGLFLVPPTPAGAATLGPDNHYGEYTPVVPYRMLDTRSGTADNLRNIALGSGESLVVPIAGIGPIPATGVSAVSVNITVVSATAPTFVTVYPSDGALPGVSNVNAAPGPLKVNAAFVRVGADGAIRVYNDRGAAQVLIDVMGFFADDNGPQGTRFHPMTPARLLDTRNTGPLGDGQVIKIGFSGLIPSTPRAVLFNVTVISTNGPNYVVAFPDGSAEPLASNVNGVAGRAIPNLVVAGVGTTSQVSFANHGSGSHLIVDIAGYWDDDRTTDAGRFMPLDQPVRWLDSRGALGPLDADHYATIPFAGFPTDDPFLPASTKGTGTVVVNTTIVSVNNGGYAVVYPGDLGANVPYASNLNWQPRETVANLTVTKVGTNDRVAIASAGADVHVIMDLQGFFTNEAF